MCLPPDRDVPSLLNACLATLASRFRLSPVEQIAAEIPRLPEADLARQIYERLHLQDNAAAPCYLLSAPQRWALLKAFATFWQPAFLHFESRIQQTRKHAREPEGQVGLSRAHQSTQLQAQPYRGCYNGYSGHDRSPNLPPARADGGVWGQGAGIAADPAIALEALGIVASNLVHLEICQQPGLTDLSPLAGLSQLQCVNLPGCLGVETSALEALTKLPRLRALSIAACSQLTDASGLGSVLAHLPALQLLHAEASGLGDASLAAACYGWKLRAWASESGTQLTQEQLVAWPALHLLQLRLRRSHVTPAGLPHLLDLPCPRLLDLRATSVKRMALLPLQRRWGLHPLQGGAVLADSVSSSLESPLGPGVVCACGQRPLQGVQPPI
ncbi:hypothetical protein WJX84_011677 [Apatococcus fuscideae]|uniref:Uncharacterized protein n=1 Tax=Apatococcus fuscideae TaxID=2026836 RepID=A0AAW1TK12_9CHLO